MTTNFDIKPIERVDDETMRKWEDLARRVRHDLAAAGIRLQTVQLDDSATWEEQCSAWERASGASVCIDPEKHADSAADRANIWIAWHPDWELSSVVHDLILNDVEAAKQHPAFLRYGEELNRMRDAMLELLKAA